MGTKKLGLFVIVNVSYILCDFEIKHQATIRSFAQINKMTKTTTVAEKGRCVYGTVFENHRKSIIQHCKRSELRLHLSGQKLIQNAKLSKAEGKKKDRNI